MPSQWGTGQDWLHGHVPELVHRAHTGFKALLLYLEIIFAQRSPTFTLQWPCLGRPGLLQCHSRGERTAEGTGLWVHFLVNEAMSWLTSFRQLPAPGSSSRTDLRPNPSAQTRLLSSSFLSTQTWSPDRLGLPRDGVRPSSEGLEGLPTNCTTLHRGKLSLSWHLFGLSEC